MNVQETQIFSNEELIEKPRRGNSWFAIVFALLSIPLIIIGIGLLFFVFATETGSVYVILPDDTPFELDASTQFGNITTVVPDMKMAYRTSTEVHGDAGTPPRASLKLNSITGSVSVFEESDGDIPHWDER